MTAITRQNEWTDDQVALIKRTICKDSTDDELSLFMSTAKRLGLDPFARQIFAVKRWDSEARRMVMSVQVSVDGFRLVAERTGLYEGQTEPQWCGADGVWRSVWLESTFPAAARIGVWKRGSREPTYAVATWRSYVQTKKGGDVTRMWASMPDVMLLKCAESLALRKAFPAELSGVYTREEMAQADERPQRRADAPKRSLDAIAGEVETVAEVLPLPANVDEQTGEVLPTMAEVCRMMELAGTERDGDLLETAKDAARAAWPSLSRKERGQVDAARKLAEGKIADLDDESDGEPPADVPPTAGAQGELGDVAGGGV